MEECGVTNCEAGILIEANDATRIVDCQIEANTATRDRKAILLPDNATALNCIADITAGCSCM